MVKSRLLNYYHITHGFGDKSDRVLDLGISCEQIHSNRVVVVPAGRRSEIKKADGLLSQEKRRLNIHTADCLPIILSEPDKGWSGILHAGWKGLRDGIIREAIRLLNWKGVSPDRLIVAIGPHIGECCYRVDKERTSFFESVYSRTIIKRKSEYFLDLRQVAVLQMREEGVLESRVDQINICTKHDARFHSHRRDGKAAGRNISFIGNL